MDKRASSIRPETINSLEQAKDIINRLQARENRYYQEQLVAKARIYDIQNYGKPEPSETELKAEVISLRNEIQKLVKQRENLKEKLQLVRV